MASRTCSPFPNREWATAQARYNYFYELVIITCNHDIAYLVRNACNANARVQSGAALGTPVRRHVVTPIRNKYMHVAKHAHGLILQFARGKSRYTWRCHPNATFTKPQRVVHVVNTLITGSRGWIRCYRDPRYQIAHAKSGITKLCYRFGSVNLLVDTMPCTNILVGTLFSVIRQNT